MAPSPILAIRENPQWKSRVSVGSTSWPRIPSGLSFRATTQWKPKPSVKSQVFTFQSVNVKNCEPRLNRFNNFPQVPTAQILRGTLTLKPTGGGCEDEVSVNLFYYQICNHFKVVVRQVSHAYFISCVCCYACVNKENSDFQKTSFCKHWGGTAGDRHTCVTFPFLLWGYAFLLCWCHLIPQSPKMRWRPQFASPGALYRVWPPQIFLKALPVCAFHPCCLFLLSQTKSFITFYFTFSI